MEISNFTLEEVHFAALHHDLYKIGLPGNGHEHYIPETEAWWRNNRGRMYRKNPNVPTLSPFDKTMMLFNHYQIPVSINEMIGIRLTDGLYEESNKEYLMGFDLDTKLWNSLPYILHHADIMAFRYEFDLWKKETGQTRSSFQMATTNENIEKPTPVKKKSGFDEGLFDKIFE